MVFLVQGNATQVFKAFGLERNFSPATHSTDTHQIDLDLPRSPFLGTEEQARHLLKTWRSSDQLHNYYQGDITAANLFFVLGPFPLKKDDESMEDYSQQFYREDFAFINEHGEPCGLMLIARRDEPDQWMLALMKNGHKVPEDRSVVLLSGFDLKPHIQEPEHDVQVVSVDPRNNPLIKMIDSPFISHQMQNMESYKSSDMINKFEQMAHLLSFIKTSNKSGSVLNKTATNDLVIRYKLRLSPAMLKDYVSKDSALKREIERIQLGKDERLNRNRLQMLVVLYEEGILEEQRALLEHYQLIRVLSGLMWDDTQIKLIPFMVQRGYDLNLIQSILIRESYYHCIYLLKELGLTEDIPLFFDNLEKREQFNFIDGLSDKSIKKLCLVFWAKGNLSLAEMKQIVNAALHYPMLAETLLALDKTHTITIQNLQKLALSPKEHQQKSILHHFNEEFRNYRLNKSDLMQLDVADLTALTHSFRILKEAGITAPDAYRLVLKKNSPGQLARLFLPELDRISDNAQRKALIKLLYVGIQKGVMIQGKELLEITDKDLSAHARHLRERFICVKQMQDLGFNKEIINFTANINNPRAKRFREVIMRVEEKCKGVHERLRKSPADRDKVGRWQRADDEYRKTLYSIAYDGIMQRSENLHARMKQAEQKILDIVDPEITSWLQKILIVIANIVITACTLGWANDIKEKNTGNYWFFTQTRSGEELRALDKEVFDLIGSSIPVEATM